MYSWWEQVCTLGGSNAAEQVAYGVGKGGMEKSLQNWSLLICKGDCRLSCNDEQSCLRNILSYKSLEPFWRWWGLQNDSLL